MYNNYCSISVLLNSKQDVRANGSYLMLDRDDNSAILIIIALIESSIIRNMNIVNLLQ